LDGPDAKVSDEARVVVAGKKVGEEYPEAVPQIDVFELMGDVRTLPFDRLVTMKLISHSTF
jgi:hypothetical protein